MPTFHRFEDTDAWKQGRALTREVYRISRKDAFSRDFGLCDQMRRAAISITSNIAEGFERDSPKQFIRFLVYAKASAGEVRSQLYVALDEEYVSEEEFEELYACAMSTIRQIASLMHYLRREAD